MELQELAERIGEDMVEAHRGVFHVECGDFIAFGNDGYTTDERARREVKAVRRAVSGQADEVGFATTADGYSWILLLRLHREYVTEAGRETFRAMLTHTLWRAWEGNNCPPEASPERLQGAIAEAVIARL